jgi:hypothetical protein
MEKPSLWVRPVSTTSPSWLSIQPYRMGYFLVVQTQAAKLAAESWSREQTYWGHTS